MTRASLLEAAKVQSKLVLCAMVIVEWTENQVQFWTGDRLRKRPGDGWVAGQPVPFHQEVVEASPTDRETS
jgi:hypothetical protein